jgi:hypothetical protein
MEARAGERGGHAVQIAQPVTRRPVSLVEAHSHRSSRRRRLVPVFARGIAAERCLVPLTITRRQPWRGGSPASPANSHSDRSAWHGSMRVARRAGM